MNTNKEQENVGDSKPAHSKIPSEDNDTYGHSSDPDAFKRKSEPNHKTDENVDASSKLKDANLTESDDLSTRNKADEKGLKGEDQ